MRSARFVVPFVAFACAFALVACAEGDASLQASGAIHAGGDDPEDPEDVGPEPRPDTRADAPHDASHDAPAGDASKDVSTDSTLATDTHVEDDAGGIDAGITDTALADTGAVDTSVAIDAGHDAAVADTALEEGIDAVDGGVDVGAPLAATWYSTAEPHRCAVGATFVYDCPGGGPLGRAWGTGEYTDDSSICTAAVHAGKLDMIAGGAITIEIRAGATSYAGSTANGVTSSDYGSWVCGFAVK